MRNMRIAFFVCLALLSSAILFLFSVDTAPVQAQGVILTNNTGDENVPWFVSGEPSLVMNGFDLSTVGITAPAVITSASIAVDTPVPGAPIDVVVYEDLNGGSPFDATLAGSFQTTIDTAGTAQVRFPEPITVNSSIIWVGFKLPVDFRFFADAQGPSVLTYWAWTPGDRFDITTLESASILGPADGTDPVDIDMNGVARITAEVRQPTIVERVESAPVGQQIVADTEVDMSVMQQYEFCSPLYYDREDVQVTGRGLFVINCRADAGIATIGTIKPDVKFSQAGNLFALSVGGQFGPPNDPDAQPNELRNPVTHCIRPQADHLEQAVIGLAKGSPRIWHILPTVRYGDMICAEITHVGEISYFIPLPDDIASTNFAIGRVIVDPHPLSCNIPPTINVTVINNGFEWAESSGRQPAGKVVVENVHIRTGAVTNIAEFHIDPLKVGPGMTWEFQSELFPVDVYIGEEHKLRFTVNFDQQVEEVNFVDNVFETYYVLQQSDVCRPCEEFEDEDDVEDDVPERCRDCDTWGVCNGDAPVRCWREWVDDDTCEDPGFFDDDDDD